MPGSFALAEAFVRIRPDATGFRAETDAALKTALAGDNPEIKISASTEAAKRAAMDLRAYLDAMAAKVHSFRLIADDKILMAQLAQVALELGKIDKTISSPKLGLEGATRVQAKLLGISSLMDELAGKVSLMHVKLDDGNTEGRIALIDAELTALTAKAHEIKLGISDPAGLMVLDELQRRINELHGKVLTTGFLETAGSAGEAMRQILLLKRLMQTAGLADFLDINMKPSQIMSQLILLKQRIESSNLSDTLAINLDTAGVMQQIAALEATLRGLPQNETVGLSAMGLGAVEEQVTALKASLNDLTASETRAAAASTGFTGGWAGWVRALGTAIPLFDNILPGILASVAAWHLLLDVTAEFLAVLIPAIVGMIAFGAAAIPTAQDIATQMQNINTVTQATGKSLYPLSGAFQKIADAVQPQVYQLFGDALTIANGKTSEFEKLATGAGQALTQLAARASSALLSGGFSQFLQNAEKDIMGLGTVVGNIFGTIGNLLKTMPGYAKYILDFFVTVTHGLEVFTGTGFFQDVAKTGLELHGAFIYAGLGVTAFSIAARGGLTLLGNLAEKAGMAALSTDALGAFGQRAGVALLGMSAGATELAALPWGWISIAAGAMIGLVYELTKVNDETSQWIGQINAWVGATNAGVAGSQRLAAAQENVAIRLDTVNKTIAGNTVQFSSWQQHAANMTGIAGALVKTWQNLASAIGFAKTPTQELTAEQQKLADQSALYHDRLGKLAVVLGGVDTAQTLLTASGVTMNQMLDGSKTAWAQILQQVNATIDAYKAMGQRAGILGADLNALNLAGSDQVTQMGNLNAAFDKLIGIISGGQTSFITFQQDMISVSQSLAQAGGSARIVTNTFPATATAIAAAATKSGASMNGLNAASLQLRQTWQTAFTGASSLIDALRMMTAINPGAQSGSFPELTQAMKDTLAQLLPLGKTSAATRAEMVSLAQEINPNITNFQQLTKWIGNVNNPAKALDKILSSLGVNIQNLAKDASTLYATLQNDLLKQFDTLKLKASGAGVQLSDLATEITHTGTSATTIHDTMARLADDMIKSGLSAQDAGTLILGMTGQIKLTGNTAAQKHQDLVNIYNDFVQAGIGAKNAAQLVSILTGELFKVPKNTVANVDANFTASGGAAIREQVQGKTWISHLVPAHGAMGMLVPGTGNRDTVPAMLMPGEAVVPKNLVRFIAPWLRKHKVPGFAGGGLVGGLVDNTAPWGGQQEGIWGSAVSTQFSNAVVRTFWAAEKAAEAAARAAATAGITGGNAGRNSGQYEMYALSLFPQHGWGGIQMTGLTPLWTRESGWNPLAMNPSSGAFGIAQALGHGLAGTGGTYGNQYPSRAANDGNAAAQIQWGEDYIAGQYGTPLNAWAHELSAGWYDHGGWLRPGLNLAWNGTGRLEKVSPPATGAQTLTLEFSGRKPDRPLEAALWDWIVGNVRIKGAGDVQLAMGTS